MGNVAAPLLLERERELEEFEQCFAALARGVGSALILEGPAGIGKTELLGAARHLAARDDVRVLSARALALEENLGWSVVRQLFDPDLRAIAAGTHGLQLDAAARLALPALGLVAVPSEGADPFASLHGLYWLTASLAQATPLLLSVDDLQWADEQSLRYLAHLIGRLDGVPVLIVGAVRAGEPSGASDVLLALLADHSVRLLRPRPLTAEATELLVQSELGDGVDTEFCRSCHELTRGNPFLVRELIRGADTSESLVSASVDGIKATPEAVSRSILARLARLPDAAAPVASAVAILGPRATLRYVAELGGLGSGPAAGAVEVLIATEILAEREGRLDFVHPLIRDAVYGELSAPAAGRLHAAAARMLSRDHLPAAEVAAHLLEATPDGDPWVVDTLRAAAATARGEGAPHLSARYLRRALEEPPLPEQRAGVLFELGIAEARDDLAAVGHLRESLALEAVPARRAEIGLLLGRTLGLAGHHGEAVDVLARARNEDGIDPELERWVEAELVGHCLHTADKLGLGFERITQAIANGRSGTSPAEKLVQVIATFAAISSAAITPDAAVRVARAAAAEPVVAHDENSSLRFFIAETLVFADAADRAVAVLDEMITEARARASMPGVALASTFRAQALLRRGDVLGAEADARTALEVVDSQILGYCRPYVLSFLIDVLVERGELEEAERLVEAEGPDAEWPELWQCGLLLGSRGRLRIAQSRIEDGVGDLLEWGRRIAPWRPRNPSAAAWRSEAAVGLAMLGRIDEAAYLAEWELRHARAMGPGRGLGVALRAAGLVEGGENGVALLRQAVDVLDRADADLESARALTDLGAMLRRQGSRVAAREPLRRGLDLATRCGATVLAGRARDELVAAGARPRRDALRGREALTPRELSAARLAAEGMSNREIAQALFVTLRTVELHLSNAYGKLNIQSRQELPDVLRPSSLVRTQSA